MRPKDMKPLVGRKVACYWNGSRTGEVVRIPRGGVVTVRFLPPHGTRQVPLEHVQRVYWYGKARSVREYLELRKDS